MRALFIGRFQPFHLGHLSVVEAIAKLPEVTELVIGIGSANQSHTADNPFTIAERIEMVTKSVHIDKKYSIVAIPDLSDHNLWIEYIIKNCPKFDRVFTTNPHVQSVFEQLGFKVIALEKTLDINATRIRQMMRKNQDWQPLVPQPVAETLTKNFSIHQIN